MHDDRARGAIAGDHGWVATTWDSLGTRPDGSTFQRPGRATIALVRRDGRWLAVHTHFTSHLWGPRHGPQTPNVEPPRHGSR